MMKKIAIKRLVFTDGLGESLIGSEEFDGALDDYNILNAVHEIGKTEWLGSSLWYLKDNTPKYRITVETFYQYQKSWYNLLSDFIKRILGL